MHSFTEHSDVGVRTCRICGDLLDAASNLGPHRTAPSDGDFSICINCGAISVFQGADFRTPTDEERELALQQPDVVTIIAFIKQRGRIR